MPDNRTALVVPRLNTPASPVTGYDKLYTKSDGSLYYLNSSGTEVKVDGYAGVIPDANLPNKLKDSVATNQVGNPDDALNTGWYYCTGSAGTNPPVGADYFIEVIFHNSLYMMQIAYGFNQDMQYMRRRSGSTTFTPWVRVVQQDTSGNLAATAGLYESAGAVRVYSPNNIPSIATFTGTVSDAQMPSGLHSTENASPGLTNLNNATSNGWWRGDSTATNTPVPGSYFHVEVMNLGGDWINQIAYQINPAGGYSGMWLRRFENSSAWTAWVKCWVTQTELDARYAAAAHNHNASEINAGVLNLARLGSALAAGNNGGLVYKTATDLANIGNGSPGQFLRSNGSGNFPIWVDKDSVSLTGAETITGLKQFNNGIALNSQAVLLRTDQNHKVYYNSGYDGVTVQGFGGGSLDYGTDGIGSSATALRWTSTGITANKPVNMNSQKITSLATPTATTDAATKAYVDSVAAGGTDSGWVNLTLTNGWVNYDSGATSGGSGRAAQIRKIHGVTYLRGCIKNNTNSNYQAFTIPATYRPGVTTTYEYADIVACSGGIASINIDAASGLALLGPVGASSPLGFTYLTGLIWPADS